MNTLIAFVAKYLITLIVLLALITFFKMSKSDRHRLIKLAALAFPVSWILAKISSRTFYDTRPFVTSHVQPLIAHAPDNGFPSDHVLLAVAITGCVYLLNKKVGFWLLVLTLILGASRVMALVHRPLDIAGSIVISSIGVSLAFLILKRFKLVDRLLSKVLSRINL